MNKMNRRGLLTGLTSLIVAAPAIVRAGSLMPVRSFAPPYNFDPILYIDDDFIFDGLKWTIRNTLDELSMKSARHMVIYRHLNDN